MSKDEREALASRVEALSGPDVYLDREIAIAVGAYRPEGWLAYTASLDASKTLVPEGWHIGRLDEEWDTRQWHAQIVQRPNDRQALAFKQGRTIGLWDAKGASRNAANALTAAALRGHARAIERTAHEQ